jgi:hypothetical protein
VVCPWCPNSPINWRDCQFAAVRGRNEKKIGEILATRDGIGRSTASMVSENERGILRHRFRFHLSYLVLGEWGEPLIAVLRH